METLKKKNIDVDYDYIFIIDCLPEDEYDKFKISQGLMQFLADNGIEQFTSICRNRSLVIATLEHLVNLAKQGAKFSIHFVSHGGDKGLWIKSTKEYVLWETFRQYLKQTNDHMNGALTINMSSCFGLHGIKIVEPTADNLPFFGLIGYNVKLKVKRAKEINKSFYSKLISGQQINEAVENTKTELSDENLFCITAQGYKIIKNTLSRHK